MLAKNKALTDSGFRSARIARREIEADVPDGLRLRPYGDFEQDLVTLRPKLRTIEERPAKCEEPAQGVLQWPAPRYEQVDQSAAGT